MVIQLGRNLGLSVIAEGVEDERQAQILQPLGCPLAQGFLFRPPDDARGAAGLSWRGRNGHAPGERDRFGTLSVRARSASAGQSRIYALSMRFSKLCASSTARATS